MIMNKFPIMLVLLFTTCFVGQTQIGLKKIKKKTAAISKRSKPTTSQKSNSDKTLDMTNSATKGPCDSNYKSLKRYLTKLSDKKAANEVAKNSFKSYLGTAQRYLEGIKSKCPDFNISSEENQLASYNIDYESTIGGNGDRQAQIRKGYYDKAIKDLVTDTHPAYNNFNKARSNLLTIAFEYFRHDKPTESFKAMKEARVAFAKIKSENSDLDLSLINSELERLEGMLDTKYGAEITKTLSKEDAVDYFRTIHSRLSYVYSDTDYGADATQGLKPGSTHTQLDKSVDYFKDFTKDGFIESVEESKNNGTYPRVQSYVEKVVAALEDYPNFISKSRGTYNAYLSQLNVIGIKGDPQKKWIN